MFSSLLYQLGLHDIFVYYTGDIPAQTYKSYMDSGWAQGMFILPVSHVNHEDVVLQSLSAIDVLYRVVRKRH